MIVHNLGAMNALKMTFGSYRHNEPNKTSKLFCHEKIVTMATNAKWINSVN